MFFGLLKPPFCGEAESDTYPFSFSFIVLDKELVILEVLFSSTTSNDDTED